MMDAPNRAQGALAVPTTKRTPDELNRLAQGIYDRKVRPVLKPEDDGKFVAIDVDTGDYVMDRDDHTAVMTLRARQPAADMWLMRVGYPTAIRIGASRSAYAEGVRYPSPGLPRSGYPGSSSAIPGANPERVS
jgi:hypothetical protein